jgi:hypothetical protein
MYMVDYAKEDGEWKFWHMIFSPFFRTSYEKGWMKVPVSGTLRTGCLRGGIRMMKQKLVRNSSPTG